MGPACERAKAEEWRLGARLGWPKKGRARARAYGKVKSEGRPGQELGQQAGMEGREGEGKEFLFFKAIFQIHFQKILNSFSILVKTNHHKNKIAAA